LDVRAPCDGLPCTSRGRRPRLRTHWHYSSCRCRAGGVSSGRSWMCEALAPVPLLHPPRQGGQRLLRCQPRPNGPGALQGNPRGSSCRQPARAQPSPTSPETARRRLCQSGCPGDAWRRRRGRPTRPRQRRILAKPGPDVPGAGRRCPCQSGCRGVARGSSRRRPAKRGQGHCWATGHGPSSGRRRLWQGGLRGGRRGKARPGRGRSLPKPSRCDPRPVRGHGWASRSARLGLGRRGCGHAGRATPGRRPSHRPPAGGGGPSAAMTSSPGACSIDEACPGRARTLVPTCPVPCRVELRREDLALSTGCQADHAPQPDFTVAGTETPARGGPLGSGNSRRVPGGIPGPWRLPTPCTRGASSPGSPHVATMPLRSSGLGKRLRGLVRCSDWGHVSLARMPRSTSKRSARTKLQRAPPAGFSRAVGADRLSSPHHTWSGADASSR
jgi:hypothetical protein